MKNTFIVLFLFIEMCGCNSNPGNKQYNNGELDNTFKTEESTTSPNLGEQSTNQEVAQTKTEEEILQEQGWSADNYNNGILPDCYNYTPRYGEYDSYLDVSMGEGSDVVIKLINCKTNKCVRYVYVNSGTTYRINKIPQGEYYLKLAYGNNWMSKNEDGYCKGKFTKSAQYQKGSSTLDFNIVKTWEGISIPSYSLELSVYTTNSQNAFSSSSIDEEQFNL